MSSKSYAFCLYMDPAAPRSLAPSTPGAGIYLLANYQWVSTPDPEPSYSSAWSGEEDHPLLRQSAVDTLCFWAVGPYERNTDFIVNWRSLGTDPELDSPIGGGSQTTLPGKDGSVPDHVVPPGFDGPRRGQHAWFFGPQAIVFGTEIEHYTFTVEAKPETPKGRFGEAHFFVDPEMETDPNG